MAKQLDNDNIPRHIAIIMDGNGRWAKKWHLTKGAGHKAGAQTLKKLTTFAEKLGVKHLTVYAFSTENWKRPADEVAYLMELLRDYIQEYIDNARTGTMKMRVIGDRSRLDEDLIRRVENLEEITKEKPGMNIVIALSYGGRNEIVRAARKMVEDFSRDGKTAQNITEETFDDYLDTRGIPDPELVIRTSGEMRLSNFLIWQCAYSEFYFTDKLWPDFTQDDFVEAISQYQQRERRFGGR